MSGLLRDKCAIVGLGYTPFSSNSGVTTEMLAVQACQNALTDAGLNSSEVDGLLTYHLNDTAPVQVVASSLGIRELRWYNEIAQGGPGNCAVILEAAMAVLSGMCETVICYRAMNGRSGRRAGELGKGGGAVDEMQFLMPYGIIGVPVWYAMWARRHMAAYGTTKAHYGQVAIAQRQWALNNDRSFNREPLTLEEYMSAPLIADPLSRLDCCREIDGACAVVVTSAERAADLRQPPVYIRGGAYGAGPGAGRNYEKWEDYGELYSRYVGPRVWQSAGLGPGDVNFAQIYDAYTFIVINQLEDFGFCAKGEGGPFVASGATAPHGALPVNTGGGMLNEGYLNGINVVGEAVTQLRGQAGVRQVPGAEVGLVSGFGGPQGSAMVLRS
ncbi:MAG TPA: acetyl-CoA acetyltransferase [Novosphingobium sp.]|nr:acetyl-CoA acetyltransferase [Novosphingobium sp.]